MCNLSSFSTIFVEGKTLRFWRLAPMVLRTLTGTQLRCLAFHEKRHGPALAFIKPLETSSSAPAWRRWPGHSERWRSAKVCFTFLLLSFWVSENISLHTISWHNIFIIIAFGYWMLLMLSFVIYSWFKNIVAEAVDSRATGLCSFLSTNSEPNVVVIDTPNWNKLRCYCNERRTAVATSTPFWNLAI